MSRTFVHAPLKLFDTDNWKYSFRKHCNTKYKRYAKLDNKKIRHSKIDEDNIELTNALKEYKRDIVARDYSW